MSSKAIEPNVSQVDLIVDNFENYVESVLSGNNEFQKAHLIKRLQNLSKLYNFTNNPTNEELLESQSKRKENVSNKLPNELWIKIMNYLSTETLFGNFAFICKRFYTISITPGTIKYLHVEDITDKYRFENVSKILKRSTTLVELKIRDCDDFLDDIIYDALESTKKLKSLIVKTEPCMSKSLEYNLMKNITESWKELENLEFEDQRMDPEGVILMGKMKNLKKLYILHNYDEIMTPQVIQTLADSTNQLEDFGFYDQSDINSEFKLALNNLFFKKSQTLKTLDIDLNLHKATGALNHVNFCKNLENLYLWVNNLSSKELKSISELQNLKNLYFNNVCVKDKLELNSMFSKLNNLESLLFQNCDFTDDDFFSELAKLKFPSLERLYISAMGQNNDIISEVTLRELVTQMPNLKSIQFNENLNQDSDITDQFLFEIFKNDGVFVIFENLCKQIDMEDYFQLKSTDIYEKYQTRLQEFKRIYLEYFSPLY